MKKVFVLVVAVIASIGISFAQHGEHGKKGEGRGKGMRKDSTFKSMTPEQKATKHSERLAQKLGLSPEQKQSVYLLAVDRISKADAVRAKYATGDKKGMHQEMKPIMQDFDAKLKAILTPDQATKWEALKTERKQKMKERKGERGEGGKNKGVKGKKEKSEGAESDKSGDEHEDGLDD